jgi:hypothetical protein
MVVLKLALGWVAGMVALSAFSLFEGGSSENLTYWQRASAVWVGFSLVYVLVVIPMVRKNVYGEE